MEPCTIQVRRHGEGDEAHPSQPRALPGHPGGALFCQVYPGTPPGLQLVSRAPGGPPVASILYKVPYQISVVGRDLGSGKAVTNNFYVRSGNDTVAPPLYGHAISGPSSLATYLGNFRTAFAFLLARLNANYRVFQYEGAAILGKRYASPLLPITALVNGPPVAVATSVPHGLVSGQIVSVAGVTTPSTVNGNWTINVLSPSALQLLGAVGSGVWSGDGTIQLVKGNLEWLLADKVTLLSTDVGLVAGDALPLFATSSVRRLNAGIGRNFRSRFSLSPMSEVDSVDGAFTVTQKALMVTALAGFIDPRANGGSDPGSGLMFHLAVSKKIAFSLASPFVQGDTWTAIVESMAQQPNTGSLVRRKPRLTATIA